MRQAIARDLAVPGIPREKVLAGIMRILSTCFLRPGSEVYADQNGSYGIATLKPGHVSVSGDVVRFDFQGKSGSDSAARSRIAAWRPWSEPAPPSRRGLQSSAPRTARSSTFDVRTSTRTSRTSWARRSVPGLSHLGGHAAVRVCARSRGDGAGPLRA